MSGAAVLAVCLAGGLGAVVRVVVDGEVRARTGGRLPWGTAVVNVLGSLLIGVVTGLLGGPAPVTTTTAALLPVLATGFCGGFTTFGTAVVEVLRLAEERRPGAAAAAAVVTVGVSTAAAGLGLVLGRLV
ncbi:CrcB family protein [uncultured Pseudokineococcus sp.]|uniref:fluoride efflux transporter FluC n=1 Tax=uncultured Pseudokineococcus sp. TaxID=1642928 RepID=UPI00262144C8|nr:CrcB family protein [uncultured Pseudokineococcus sp.]